MTISETFKDTEEYQEAVAIFQNIRDGTMSLAAFLRIMEYAYWQHKRALEDADRYSRMAYPDTTGR